MLCHDGQVAVAAEGDFTGQHLKHHDAKRVDVRSPVTPPAFDLFRRHVLGRSGSPAHVRIRYPVTILAQREAKIQKDGLTFRRDKDVLRFDIAMNDFVVMAICKRIGDSANEINSLSGRNPRPSLETFPQRFSLNQLGDQVRHALEPSRPEPFLNRRMIERPHDLELPLESLVIRRVADKHDVGDLQNRFPGVNEIECAVHISHSSPRNVAPDLKVIELVANLKHRGTSRS